MTQSFITGLQAGNYCVTATDANACANISCLNITQPTDINIIVDNITNVVCRGGTTGQVGVVVSGGFAPYSYNWNTGSTTATIAGQPAGQYCVTITDGNACQKVLCTTITEPANAITVTANVVSNFNGQNISCFGEDDGAAQAQAIGGTGTISYLWDLNSQTTALATGMAAGTYCVVATDQNTCRDTTCITLVQPAQVTSTISSITNVLCRGLATGQAIVTASGGLANYTYLWDDALDQTTATATGLAAGIYSVTTTDRNNCFTATSVTISQPSFNLGVSATVVTPYNGQQISCTSAADGQATASATGGVATYSYLWSNGQTNATVTGIAAGQHCVTTTDANGCTAFTCVTLQEPSLVVANTTSIVNVLCRGNATGEATAIAVGGTLPYTYNWATTPAQTTQTAINLAVGSYNVTVTDANNCRSVAVATISEPASFLDVVLNVSSNYNGAQISCVGANDGTVTAVGSNGTAPYSFAWNIGAQTTATATGLAANNTYVVTITDANNCQDTSSIVLVAPSAINITFSNVINVACRGSFTGAATALPVGGTGSYTFAWSNSQTSATTNNQPAGVYAVTVTDDNNCFAVASLTLTEPASTLQASTVVVNNASCQGLSNGTATASATGGVPNYSYQWSASASGQQTATATALPAGNHTVTITDANLCTSIATVMINQPAVVTATISSTTSISCNSLSNGTATALAQGGTGPYTYNWATTPAQTTQTAINLVAGSYSVTVLDANACSSVAVAVINQPASALVVNALVSSNYNGADISCIGLSDGQATASVVGGTTPYQYLWSVAGQTTAIATGLAAGNNYQVTVTDNNNCQAITTVSLTSPSAITATIANQTNVLCRGQATGTVTLSVTGGTVAGPYTYAWATNGQTTSTATGLSAGLVTVSVSDANLCQQVTNINITEPASVLAVVASVVTPPSCNNSNNAVVVANVSGGTVTTGYSYNWSFGQFTDTATTVAGIHSVTVSDNNACTATANVTVTAPNAVIATIVSTTPVVCRGTATGSATAGASGGVSPYRFTWSNGQTNATAINLVQGGYTVTVEDANGCLSTTSINIIEPATVLAATTAVISNYNGAQTSCTGTADAVVQVTPQGGAGNYQFIWSVNNATTAIVSGLSAGSYDVSVTDINGCTVVTAVTVVAPTSIITTINSTDALCSGTATGTAQASVSGGTQPYQYLWSVNAQTTATATGLSAGIHTLTLTDANGCQDVTNVVIGQPALSVQVVTSVISDYNGAQIRCANTNDGVVLAQAFGGIPNYAYAWSSNAGNATTATVSGLGFGIYNVTATDVSGCQGTASVTIVAPAAITASIASTTNVTCRNQANGFATAQGNGGTGAYTYLWANNQTNATATGLAAGTHNVTVSDANGCAQTAIAVISQPANALDVTTIVSSNYNGQQISCNGAADGSIDALVVGGTAPYTFVWSAGTATTVTITGLSAGGYCVTATDANGCTDVACITLVEPSPTLVTLVSTVDVDCRGAATGEATVQATGSLGVFSYAWAHGPTTATATGLAAGTYTVQATDLNACSAVLSITISEPATALFASANVVSDYRGQQISCNAATDGILVALGTGGTLPYTYLWSNSANAQVSDTAFNVASGTHQVTITDDGGCTSIASVTITQPTAVSSTITSVSNASCNGTATGSATVVAAGGIAGYTYLWSDVLGQTTATAVNLTAGSYTVTVQDANGCQSVATTAITQPATTVAASAIVTSNYSGQQVSCNGSTDGTALASGLGGLAPYTFVWSNTQTTATATGLQSGVLYTVTVTDFSGCVAVTSVTLSQPSIVSVTTTTTTSPSCNGAATGTALVSATGGVGGYTFAWPNSQTTAQATGLAAGNYTVTTTDANGCTATTIVNITQPNTALVLNTVVSSNYNGQDISCNGLNNGAATVQIAGGNAPYAIVWSIISQTTITATGLSSGAYTVSVTDANGCQQTSGVFVNEPAAITATIITQQNVDCRNNATGLVTVQATGGTPSYTYNINAPVPANNGTFSQLPAGSYAITVQDLNFCTTVVPVVITQPTTALTIAATVSSNYNGQHLSCANVCDGEATVTASGATAPYTILWSNNSQTTLTATGLCAGTHSVVVTDANGCQQNAVVTLTAPSLLTASVLNTTNVVCAGDLTGTAQVRAVGGTPTYVFSISGQSNTTGNFTGLADGNYVATITDRNACSATTNFNILAPNALVISAINVTSNYNGAQISCNGASNGAATVVAAGGTGTYQFLWSNGQTTFTATGLSASQSVTVTDQNGCRATAAVTLVEPAILDAFVDNQSNINCSGATSGSIVIDATGGVPAYAFNIGSGNQANGVFNNLPATNHCITVTDLNGCSDVVCVNLTQNSTITATATVTSNYNNQQLSCATSSDATAQVTANGGTLPYSFVWSNTQTTATANGLPAGVSTVTITDDLGCTAVASVTIVAPSAVGVSVTSQSNVLCNGQPTGGFAVTAAGGTAPYQYSINGGISFTNTVNYTNLPAAAYTVIVRDANNCQSTVSTTVTEPAAVQGLISNQVAVSCNGGNDGQATVTGSGGTAPYLYDFQLNGTFTQVNTFTNLLAGTYTVRVRDAVGCITNVPVTITQPSALLLAVVSSTNPTCVNACDGSIQVTASGGTAGYQYAVDGVNFQASPTFAGLCDASYTILVRDAQGCQTSVTRTLTQPTAVVVNAVVTSNFNSFNVSCNGATDGTASAVVSGGNGGYSIIWTGGATSLSVTGLAANTSYIVQATDVNGCVGRDTIVLTQPNLLTAAITSQTNISCNGAANGAVIVNATANTGVGPYNYNIGFGNQISGNFSALPVGTYNITVSDANNCTVIVPVNITAPAAISITSMSVTSNYNGAQISCNGANNATATVAAAGGTGAYAYLWSAAGQTTATATGLGVGTQTVVVTDANGCSVSQSVVVTQPAVLTATVTTDSAGCNGAADGEATIAANDGTAPYQYSIDGGTLQASGVFTNLTAGTYTLLAQDANGCSTTRIVQIRDRSAITANATVTSNYNGAQISCNGLTDGTATATASGGAGNFTFAWSNSLSGASITGLAAGTYTVTATDAIGCSSTATITVTEPAIISLAIASQTNVGCGGNNNGTVNVEVANGGIAPYTFNIGNGTQPTGNFTNLQAGAYTVTVTDGNSCSATIAVAISEPTQLSVTTSSTNVSCFGLRDGTASATVTGGTPFSNGGFLYSWNVAGAVTANIGSLQPGIYRVTVSDAAGCTATTQTTVTELPAVLISTVATTDVACNGANDGDITITAQGGSGTYQYSIDGGTTFQAANNFTGLGAGAYAVVIRDANNLSCDDVQTVEILGNNGLVATATATAVACAGNNNGNATVTVSGGAGNYTYIWSNGQTTATATGLASNFRDSVFTGSPYSVTVSDANGCTVSVANIAVQSPDSLNVTIDSIQNVSCFAGADGAAIATVTGGSGIYTFAWSNGATTDTLTNVEAFNYSVLVTDSNGCTDTATVAITEPTFPLVAFLSGDTTTCFGGFDGVINIDSITGGTPFDNGGYEFSFLQDGPYGSDAILAQGLPADEYTVFVRDANNCLVVVNDIIIAQPADVVVTAFQDQTIRLGETVDLYATVSQSGIDSSNVTWSYVNELGDTIVVCTGGDCLTQFVPSNTDLYQTRTFVVNLNNGCNDTSSVLITVDLRQSVFVPNAFSPNGDGTNDIITVFGSSDVRIVNEFLIFDRWGELVHQAQDFAPGDFNAGWDGTFKNKNMNPAVFVFFAKVTLVNGEEVILKGDVTLLR